jgi:hypothetical protein
MVISALQSGCFAARRLVFFFDHFVRRKADSRQEVDPEGGGIAFKAEESAFVLALLLALLAYRLSGL